MLKRLKDNFDKGVEKLKWFASLLADRLRVEISVIRLLHQSEQMERKRDDLLKAVGKRVYEMKERADAQILKDAVVSDAIREIERISEEIESIRKKAS